jgi:hypothetical protein
MGRRLGRLLAILVVTGLTTVTPTSALWVDTAELYFLPSGEQSIVTDGLEGNGVILRAVTGATGQYRGYLGQQQQEFLGFNATGGVNLHVTFFLEKGTNRPHLGKEALPTVK